LAREQRVTMVLEWRTSMAEAEYQNLQRARQRASRMNYP